MKTATKKLAPSLLLLIFFVIACARLGLWQWDRAAEFNKKEPDRPRVALTAIATPGTALDADAVGRRIWTEGSYSRSWLVTDRVVGDREGNWDVALLQTAQGNLLVVRSWNKSSLPLGQVRVEGRLYPAQNPETSSPSGELSRVDPALIVNEVNGPLYDGFVIASAETPAQAVERVPSPQPTRNPPGYYWQHISYVILWWFFGLVAVVVWLRSAREELKR